MKTSSYLLANYYLATLFTTLQHVSFAFQLQNPTSQYYLSKNKEYRRIIQSTTSLNVVNTSGKGFAQSPSSPILNEDNADDDANNDDTMMNELILKMNPTQIKEKLLDLLPRMTGTPEEFKYVEAYVNALEEKFIAPQTLDFLNLAMVGEWQFLFTTNQLGRPSPKLRLTELIQKVEVDGLEGKLTNQVCLSLFFFVVTVAVTVAVAVLKEVQERNMFFFFIMCSNVLNTEVELISFRNASTPLPVFL